MSFRAICRSHAAGTYTRLASPRIVYASAFTVQRSSPRLFSHSRYLKNEAQKTDTEKQQSLESTLLNPPESCRPPPIELPVRENFTSGPSYIWNMARTIAKFYWKGIKQINTNRKLLADTIARTPKNDRPSILSPWKIPDTFSRADWILLWRVRHDLMRLPLFGLMLCTIGELTILVVLLFPAIVPLTCRLPNQKRKAIERSEARRADIFQQMDKTYPEGVLSSNMNKGAARSLVLRNLYLTGNIWETVKATPPGTWGIKGSSHIKYLVGDDKNLLKDGAPSGMIKDELRNACMERGINVANKSESDLRALLGDWLRLTNAESDVERRRRMLTLLLTRQDQWPANRDFKLPEIDL